MHLRSNTRKQPNSYICKQTKDNKTITYKLQDIISIIEGEAIILSDSHWSEHAINTACLAAWVWLKFHYRFPYGWGLVKLSDMRGIQSFCYKEYARTPITRHQVWDRRKAALSSIALYLKLQDSISEFSNAKGFNIPHAQTS